MTAVIAESSPLPAQFEQAEPWSAEYGSGLPEKIVVIGGGTGSSTVVRALTASPFSGEGVTAIATTFDDGGGTGELRKAYGDLPAVGDLRQCLDAMSTLSGGARRALAKRFGEGDISSKLNIGGQTLGNLVIAATIQSELEAGGTFSSALDVVGELLQIKGKVAPPSDDIRTLIFDLPGGSRIFGEHKAEVADIPSLRGTQISFLDGHVDKVVDVRDATKPATISEEAETAIKEGDLVVIAPGDLYTSIGPNLAVRGMKQALVSARVVVMISNLMNRDRHTVDFSTFDYAEEMTRLIGAKVIQRTLFSTTSPDAAALVIQAKRGSYPVRPDVDALKKGGYGPRGFDLISRQTVALDPNDVLAETRSQIRHDPAKIAAGLFNIYTNNGFSSK